MDKAPWQGHLRAVAEKKYDIHIEFPGAPEPPAPTPPSRARIAWICVAIVLTVAILTGLGIWFFSRPSKTGEVAVKEMTPEMAVKSWYGALLQNHPETLWNALPEAMQKRAAGQIEKFGATVAQDAELYKRGVRVARNFVGLVDTKKALLLDLMNYKPKQNLGLSATNLGSIIGSLTGEKGAATKLPDPAQIAAGLVDQHFAGLIAQYKVEAWKLDATASILQTLLESKLNDPSWLAKPDLAQFMTNTGGALMSKLDVVPAQSGSESWKDGFKKPLGMVVAKTLSTQGDTAVVEVEHPALPFLGLPEGKRSYTLKRSEAGWSMTDGDEIVFGAVLSSVDGVAARARQMEQYRDTAARLGLLGKGDRAALLAGLDDLDKLIGEISQMRDADELVGLMRRKVMGHLDAFAALEANGTGPVVTSGTIAPRSTGSNNATRPPESTIDFSTVPASGPGRGVQWTIYDANSQYPYRIDSVYVQQPESIILKAFGRPDLVEGGFWVYRGVKVFDKRTSINCTTVYFGIKGGKVDSVLAR